MLEEHFRRPRVCERIRSNPIAEQILEFIEFLDQRGHSFLTIQLYGQAVEHFGRWLEQSGHLVISQKSVNDFLVHHLPSCCFPTPASHQLIAVRAALRHLLRLQCSQDADQAVTEDPLTQLLMDYDGYLNRNAGLAEATRHYRRKRTPAPYGHGRLRRACRRDSERVRRAGVGARTRVVSTADSDHEKQGECLPSATLGGLASRLPR